MSVDTYALTPDQVDFRDTIRQIVRERVAPRAAEIDAKAEYPWDLRKLFGTEELKQRFLPKCASGEWSPAFALSEPEAGSDPGGMITRAVKDGDEWVVTGTKNWISNLGIADFYIVFAKTDPSAPRSRA